MYRAAGRSHVPTGMLWLVFLCAAACQNGKRIAETTVDGGRNDGALVDGARDGTQIDAQSAQCGDGICADSETHGDCPADCFDCNGLSVQGCCTETVLFWCDGETVRSQDCGQAGCGWVDSATGYGCGATRADPSGNHPHSCGCENARPATTKRIFHGTATPTTVCLSNAQTRAVGAVAELTHEGYSNYCTGTLVTPDRVLTAAHCLLDPWGVRKDPADVFFLVGRDAAAPDHVFAVEALYVHPDYSEDAAHDIGLLVLFEKATVAVADLEPIAVNTYALNDDFVDSIVENGGYGSTHDNAQNTLRWWTTEPVVEISDGEYVVYGNGWSSVCYGDSGGPSLYMFGDGDVRLVGTVSWGDPSCVDYDHFARVDTNSAFLSLHDALWSPCTTLDGSGRCRGEVAQWCENGVFHQQCCADGCAVTGQGLHRCLLPRNECGALDALGQCHGDELIWCRDGTRVRRFCNVCDGLHCGWVDETLGYGCLP
jgi:V8-like Glu-specific endopeptidase